MMQLFTLNSIVLLPREVRLSSYGEKVEIGEEPSVWCLVRLPARYRLRLKLESLGFLLTGLIDKRWTSSQLLRILRSSSVRVLLQSSLISSDL